MTTLAYSGWSLAFAVWAVISLASMAAYLRVLSIIDGGRDRAGVGLLIIAAAFVVALLALAVHGLATVIGGAE